MKIIQLLKLQGFCFGVFFSSILITSNIFAQNIGIGTANPTDKFHIYGGDLRVEDASNPWLMMNSLTSGGWAGLSLLQNNTNTGWLFFDDSADLLRMTTSTNGSRADFVMNTSGNIGIGTLSPSYKFHISQGDMAIYDNAPFLIFNSTISNNTFGINIKQNGSNVAWMCFDDASNVLRLNTDAAGTRNDFIIKQTGEIGIGTASPSSKLHVSNGDITVDKANPFVYINATQTNTSAGINIKQNGSSKGWLYYEGTGNLVRMSTDASGFRNDLVISSTGYIGAGISTPTSKLHVSGGDMRVDDASAFVLLNSTSVNNSTGIKFEQNSSNRAWLYYDDLTDILRINTDPSGGRNDLIIKSSGYVGVGTSNPSTILHVVGGDITVDETAPYLILNSAINSNAGVILKENGSNNGWLTYSGSSNVLRLTTDVSGARNDIAINTSGNVGIGTASPASKLHVWSGDIQADDDFPFLILNSTVANNNSGIVLKENGTSKAYMAYNGTEDVLKFSMDIAGNRNDMTISTAGKVGLGTSSPEEVLHVEGTIEVDQKIQANDAGGLELATDEGTTRIMIMDDGRIGMGTSSPASGSRLHLYGGDLTVEETQAFIYLNSTSTASNAGLVLKQAGSNRGWLFFDDYYQNMTLSTDASGARDDLAINSLGRIGMGTPQPGGHKLFVTSSGTGASGSTQHITNSAASGIALTIENTSYSSNDNVLIVTSYGSTGSLACFDSYHGSSVGWDREFKFTNTGDGRCDGSWITGGADYAEFFPMAYPEEILQPGDVIAISEKAGYTVEKATSSKNQLILGVYSTKPAIIGNSSAEEDPEDAALVGLMGVVPTKVCTENGPIRIGDYVTISSQEGVAAKAVRSGTMIGRALENYEESSPGMVKVMVDINWVDIDGKDQQIESLQAQIEELRAIVLQYATRE